MKLIMDVVHPSEIIFLSYFHVAKLIFYYYCMLTEVKSLNLLATVSPNKIKWLKILESYFFNLRNASTLSKHMKVGIMI